MKKGVALMVMLVVVVVSLALAIGVGVEAEEVTYDGRFLIIDKQRKILFSGSIHYPRSTPQRQQNGRICKCNLTAVIRVSNTSKNPGRLFYGCPKLKVADRCNFFLWLDNECVGDGCISEATSRLGFTASSNDEDWKKSVAKRLKHVESEIRRIRWTMMVLCVVLGFVMGILWEK